MYNIDFSSTTGEHTTNGKEDETSPEAADAGATEYQDDPAAEVFGTAGDQVKDIPLPRMTNILIVRIVPLTLEVAVNES